MRDWELWWKAAGIRAIKTIAEAAIGAIGGASMFSSIDWKVVLSSSIVAGMLSLLISIRGLPEIDMNDSNYEDVKEHDAEIEESSCTNNYKG